MGMRKDYYLREAAQTLAMIKAVHLHDLMFVRRVLPAAWVKRSLQVSAQELDEAGIRVRQSGDTYNFVQEAAGSDLSLVSEAVDQWRIEALDQIEGKASTVVALAASCGISRQSLYRIVKNNNSGLQHYFTLRGRVPILQWRGRPLTAEYERCRADLKSVRLMEGLV